MKRTLALLLVLFLLGSTASFAALPEEICFTEEEAAAMSNYMQRGRYCFDGNTMYGIGFAKTSSYPSLVRSEITMNLTDPNQGELTVLDRKVNANFLTEIGEKLYYIRIDRETELCCLACIGKDGSGFEKLTEESSSMDYLLLQGDRFFFTDEEHYLVSVDLGGGDRETVLEKAVFYPYFLTDDLLIYQDDADGETLHLYRFSDASDFRLTEMRSYHPIVSGSYLYFAVVPEGEKDAHLARLDLSQSDAELELAPGTMGKEFSIFNGTIYGSNGAMETLESWEKYSDTGSRGITRKNLYMSEDFTVRADLRSDYNTVDYLYLIYTPSGKACMFRHVY